MRAGPRWNDAGTALSTGRGLVLSALMLTGARMPAHAMEQGTLKTEDAGAAAATVIHQEVDLAASPARVYAALLDATQFRALTGGQATEIQADAGGAFSCFGGHIVGRNVELIPDRRIVQAWRVVTWPEGIYSIARFELKPQGAGTRLVFDHTAFPAGLHDHLAAGWEEHYWAPLRGLK
jgi:activator of HSP90 ATPase